MAIFLNNEVVKTANFPGGECHVQIDHYQDFTKVVILAYLYNSDDIMHLLLTIDAIRRVNINAIIELLIPYFPYARQDRVCNKGEAFSVAVMANIIHSLKCDSVTIFDPHSEVTPNLLDNCKIVSLAEIIKNSILVDFIINNNLTLVSPDNGAKSKVIQVAEIINNNTDIIFASKKRITTTGEIISNLEIGDVKNKDLIILDDICDGGKTFINLAKILKEKGANNIYLYVTHGIFSKKLDILKPYFKHIYCYHSMLDPKDIDNDFLTILNKNPK